MKRFVLPKIGDKIFVKAEDIHRIEITQDNSSSYGYKLSASVDNITHEDEILKDKYLLFEYVGDGLFKEIFSEILLHITFVLDDSILNEEAKKLKMPGFECTNDNYMEFAKGYQKSLTHPLIIFSDNYYNQDISEIFEVNDEIKNAFEKNLGLEAQIGLSLYLYEDKARAMLCSQMKRIIKEDLKSAYSDNILNDKPKRLRYEIDKYRQYSIEDYVDMN